MNAKSVASYLNQLCEADHVFVSLLMRCAVECGPELATHPSIKTPVEPPDANGNYVFTVLDILNSMLLSEGDDVLVAHSDSNDPVMIDKVEVARKWWQ